MSITSRRSRPLAELTLAVITVAHVLMVGACLQQVAAAAPTSLPAHRTSVPMPTRTPVVHPHGGGATPAPASIEARAPVGSIDVLAPTDARGHLRHIPSCAATATVLAPVLLLVAGRAGRPLVEAPVRLLNGLVRTARPPPLRSPISDGVVLLA